MLLFETLVILSQNATIYVMFVQTSLRIFLQTRVVMDGALYNSMTSVVILRSQL